MAPTTAWSRSLSPRTLVCRECLRTGALPAAASQRRWIGDKYMAKMRMADREWQTQAQEISSGARKNLFDELEERGFVKDVVG